MKKSAFPQEKVAGLLQQATSTFYHPSEGTVYPVLRQFMQSGYERMRLSVVRGRERKEFMQGFIVLGAVLLFFLAGCRPARNESARAYFNSGDFNAVNALTEIKALAEITPRHSGSPGAQKAAEHLLERLRAFDIETFLDEFEEETPVGKILFRNVIGVLPLRPGDGCLADQWIIVGAHYDNKGGISDDFEGANDSGSGIGVALELARVIKNSLCVPASSAEAFCDLSAKSRSATRLRRSATPRREVEGRVNILLAFFDGEECRNRYGKNDGLHGSRRLASQLVRDGRSEKVRAVIILDMVGESDLNITVPRNSNPGLISALFKAAEAEGAREKFTLWRGEIVDDHQPFSSAGMPAIVIIDFEYGSAPGRNDYWHTTEDTLDKLSVESLEIVGRTTLRMLDDLLAPGSFMIKRGKPPE